MGSRVAFGAALVAIWQAYSAKERADAVRRQVEAGKQGKLGELEYGRGTSTVNARADYLEKYIEKRIKQVDKKRRKEKRIAFWLRVAVVAFSGAITVLLGLQANSQTLTVTLSNIALVLSALITVLSAVDAFYNYRNLYIHRTVLIGDLEDILRQLQYYKVGDREGLTEEKLDVILRNLSNVLVEDLNAWRQLRGDAGTIPPVDSNSRSPVP